jgi:hypothetical protein
VAHDVFICHSSEDKVVANAACAKLEGAGVRCWIAPRDPIPGVPYSRQLVDAVDGARVFLLIFSKHTAQSEHVMRELELAADRNKIIVPFRIDATEPSADLEYYIRRVHWLDAMTPPREKRLDELVTLVQRILGTTTAPTAPEQAPKKPTVTIPSVTLPPMAMPAWLTRRTALIAGAAVLALIILVLIVHGARSHPKAAAVAVKTAQPRRAYSAPGAWWHPYKHLATFWARGVNCVAKGAGMSEQLFRIYNGSGERMYYDVGTRQVYPEGYGETIWMERNNGYRFYLEPNQQSGLYYAKFPGRCSGRFQVILFDVRYGIDRGPFVALS